MAAFAGAFWVLPRTVAHPGIHLDTVGMVLIGAALTAIGEILGVTKPAAWERYSGGQ